MHKIALLFLITAAGTFGGTLLDEGFSEPQGGRPPNWFSAVASGSGTLFVVFGDQIASSAQSYSEVQLYSPLLTTNGLPLTVTLLHRNNADRVGGGGTVLEYSINGNAYQDVLSTYSQFLSGDYNGEVQSPNPLVRTGTFRKAWLGDSQISTILITPPSSGTIQFRFALGASDNTLDNTLQAVIYHFSVVQQDPVSGAVPEPATFLTASMAAVIS